MVFILTILYESCEYQQNKNLVLYCLDFKNYKTSMKCYGAPGRYNGYYKFFDETN